jgi:hypothetical protein
MNARDCAGSSTGQAAEDDIQTSAPANLGVEGVTAQTAGIIRQSYSSPRRSRYTMSSRPGRAATIEAKSSSRFISRPARMALDEKWTRIK